MALTEIYVDPSIAADSGSGTVGDPYGDLEWALSQESFDTTNGSRINIKSGTAEILTASMNITTNFTSGGGPSATAPLVIQGYASAANDGNWDAQTGIGRIDCNNNSFFASNTYDFITLRHLEIFGRAGAGYAYLVYLDLNGQLIECELHTHSGTSPMVGMGNLGSIIRCHAHNVMSSEYCLNPVFSGMVLNNYLELAGGSALAGINTTGIGSLILGNIIEVDGSTDGINLPPDAVRVVGNSIYSNAGTGQGIRCTGAGDQGQIVLNNVVEGFSGAGGIGIQLTSTGWVGILGGNHVSNCATNYSVTSLVGVDLGDNEDLSGTSPFTDAANEDYTPVDVGNMNEGAWPPSIESGDGNLTAVNKRWKGAIEPAGGGGGGGASSILGAGDLQGGFAA